MIEFSLPIILLLISIILLFLVSFYIIKMKNKKQIHYAFLSLMAAVLIWSLGQLLTMYTNNSNMIYVYIYFIGVCFSPVSILLIGLIFFYTNIKFSYKYLYLALFPIVDYIMLLTNKFHNLYFIKYSIFNNQAEYGSFYFVHAVVSYIYILVGLCYLVYFSIKNSGFFSKQSILIIIGTLAPLMVNIFQTLNIITIPVYYTAISFAFATICYALAILKFNLFNITPIALQNVVDQISDSYVIVNEELEATDYNKTFVDIFSDIFQIKRKGTLAEIIKPEGKISNIEPDKLVEAINEAIKEKKTVSFDRQIISGAFDKYFTIEITPIIKNDNHLGTIILLKDITQHIKDMDLIKQAHNQLLQRDRLASLGELAGGVAHDINSPLSAIMGGLMFVERLFLKYRDSFNDENVTPEKRKEMEEEILHQIINSSNASQKIVKIVNSIRNHTRNLSGENIQDFYVSSVFEDIKILLNHQLKGAVCELEVEAEDKMLVNGDPGKLGQVLTNLVVNALQAYNGDPGKVMLKSRKEDDNIIITVEDNAGGIPEIYREGIFSKMLTTKGAQGTGLGLYLSYSIITGHFGGRMWFDTEEGKGTNFYISIPIKKIKKEN